MPPGMACLDEGLSSHALVPGCSLLLPLSHVSMVAKVSLCCSTSAASLYINSPLSELAMSLHSPLKALRAAATALSTSSGSAASTEQISDSSLQTTVRTGLRADSEKSYVGFTLVILFPLLDLTHSLLMKRPVGWVYLTPFGAVRSMLRPDMMRDVLDKDLMYFGKSDLRGGVDLALNGTKTSMNRRLRGEWRLCDSDRLHFLDQLLAHSSK